MTEVTGSRRSTQSLGSEKTWNLHSLKNVTLEGAECGLGGCVRKSCQICPDRFQKICISIYQSDGNGVRSDCVDSANTGVTFTSMLNTYWERHG